MPRRALVAGASRGLGLGLARELARRGYEVIATVRDPHKAGTLGENIRVEVLDIDDPASVAALRDRLRGHPLDLLYINAGVSGPKHADASQATWEEVGALFLTNAVAPIRLARALLGEVKEGGVVAFMSSVLGSIGGNTSGGSELYRASKAALNSLVQSFRAGIGDRRLTVLTLHPGWVRTDMGGERAPLDVETSVRGLVDVVEEHARSGVHGFFDYKGESLPW